jgi:hypothetical protein
VYVRQSRMFRVQCQTNKAITSRSVAWKRRSVDRGLPREVRAEHLLDAVRIDWPGQMLVESRGLRPRNIILLPPSR